jgi:hypothetical protein
MSERELLPDSVRRGALRAANSRRLNRARPALPAVIAVFALAVAGCGDSDDSGGSSKPRLTVSAAASLKKAFTAYGGDISFARAARLVA